MPEGDVTQSQMGTTYVEQADGSKVIPGSRRPDGTLRKAIRVKEGYIPSEENKYESMGQKMAQRSAYPPGFAPPEESSGKQRIPGLPDDYVEQNAKKAAKKKKQQDKKADEAPKKEEAKETAPAKEAKPAAAPAPAAATAEGEAAEPEKQVAEPEKRLKNVKKKLAEIEALEAKPKGSLSADQQKKVGTKAEFEAEARYLDKILSKTAAGMSVQEAKEAAMPKKKKGPAEVPVVPTAKALSPEPVPSVPSGGYAKPQPKAGAKAEPKKAKAPEPEPVEAADAAKRIRNVKKKIAEIEKLQSTGAALSADQQLKVSRKKDLEVELKFLEKQVK